MNELAKQASDLNQSLYGLPGDVILMLFCVSTGMFLKTQDWFPNKRIPLVVMAMGLIGGPLMYIGHYDHSQSMTHQILTHIMIGSIVSSTAWVLHAQVIKKLEPKIPFLGALLASSSEKEQPTSQEKELVTK